jgi:hypothetical protein
MDFFREYRFTKEVALLYNRESFKICSAEESPELVSACNEKRKNAFNKLKIILHEHKLNEMEGKTILLDRKANFDKFF